MDPPLRELFCLLHDPISMYCENFVRGPLVPMEGEPYEKMLSVMREYGLNV